MIKLPKKRINLESYLKKLILISLIFLSSLLFQTFVIEVIELNNLYETNDLNKVFWYDYYSVFHYNFLPVLLLIWVIILSVNRLHDSNKSGYLIFVPLINLYWLFASGDANENRFGLPKNNNSKVVYFDELNKEIKKSLFKNVYLKGILVVLFFIIFNIIYNQNSNITEIPQLFNEKDVNPFNNNRLINYPSVAINPLKSEKTYGRIKICEVYKDKIKNTYFFDKKGFYIKKLSDEKYTKLYYKNKKLDYVVRRDKDSIRKYLIKYSKLSDRTIIEQFNYLNSKLNYINKWVKSNYNTLYTGKSFEKDKKSLKINYDYNNYGLLTTIKDNEDLVKINYDINNNPIELYNNSELKYKFGYNAQNKLVLFENLAENVKFTYEFDNFYPIRILSTSNYDLENKKSISFEDDNLAHVQYQYWNDINDTYSTIFYIKRDYKNNIIHVPFSDKLVNFNKGWESLNSYFNKEDIRKYHYYNTYFDLYVKFFKSIIE
jgi:uncharacterized membrane protein YhaH (DUF805 family)